MGFIETLGTQLGGSAIGAGMGMMMGDYNDRRQKEQQQKLQNMQITGQKDMMDYGYQKQMQMWKETNFKAQVDELNKAGLNAGLIYGMGGGGGTTTGQATGNVQGASAPQGGREIQDMTGMGMQMGQLAAQTALLQAQTEKAKTETTKIGGVDTELAKANVESTWQGIDNARNTNTIQKLDITMKNIENFEKQASQEDRLDYIEYQSKIAEKQMRLIGNEQKVSDATIQANINKIKAESIGAVLKNILTQSQTDKTKSDIQVNNKEMNVMTQKIMMDWDKMSQTEREIRVKEALKNWTTDPNREAVNHGMNAIGTIMQKRGTTVNNFYE